MVKLNKLFCVLFFNAHFHLPGPWSRKAHPALLSSGHVFYGAFLVGYAFLLVIFVAKILLLPALALCAGRQQQQKPVKSLSSAGFEHRYCIVLSYPTPSSYASSLNYRDVNVGLKFSLAGIASIIHCPLVRLMDHLRIQRAPYSQQH